MPMDKEELLRYSLELQQQNPDITKEELMRLLREMLHTGAQPLHSAEQTELKPQAELPFWNRKKLLLDKALLLKEVMKGKFARPLSWLGQKRNRWRVGVGVMLILLAVGAFCEPKAVGSVAQKVQQLFTAQDDSGISPADKAAYLQEVQNSLAQEGAGPFLGKLAADAINDTDIAAVNVRLLELGQGPVEQYKANLAEYIWRRQLIMACIVKNNKIDWPPKARSKVKWIKEMFKAADSQVLAFSEAYDKNDFAGMKKALQKVRRSYTVWARKGGLQI